MRGGGETEKGNEITGGGGGWLSRFSRILASLIHFFPPTLARFLFRHGKYLFIDHALSI